MSPRTIAFWAIIFSSIFWSTAGVSGKILLKVYDPFIVAFFRFFFASLVITPFLFREKLPPRAVLFKKIIPISLLSAGNISFFYLGLRLTTANAAGIIYTAVPLLVALLSFYIIKERLSRLKIIGILLGAIGVILVVALPVIDKAGVVIGDVRGNLLVCLAVISWSLYTLGSRHLIKEKIISAVALSGVSIISNAVVFFILSLIFVEKPFMISQVSSQHILLILHLALFVTVGTYLLFQWAIQHTSAATAALTNYLQPIFGSILAVVFLGENLTLGFIFSSILVFIGVLIATGNVTKDFLKVFLRMNRE